MALKDGFGIERPKAYYDRETGTCSRCGWKTSFDREFCPTCGAEFVEAMKGGDVRRCTKMKTGLNPRSGA